MVQASPWDARSFPLNDSLVSIDLFAIYGLGSDNSRSEDRPNSTNPPLDRRPSSEMEEHRERLIEGLEFSRWFILTYQPAIVAIVVLVVLWKSGKSWRRARRRSRRQRRAAGDDERDGGKDIGVMQYRDNDGASISSSSSNSTRAENATATSLSAAEGHKTPHEWSPLLNAEPSKTHSQRPRWSMISKLRSWLMYQPPNLPLFNKVLPNNTTTLIILALTSLNIFYLIYNIRPSLTELDILADRAGLLFTANLPWLYLLSAKNCLFSPLTGHSYENLNLLHRRLGEFMCVLAAVHLAGMISAWYNFLRPFITLYGFLTVPYILWGCLAWICYEVLYLTGLGSFRAWWYEVFLGSHVFLQIGALAMLYLHHFRSRPYVVAAVAIFVLDRLVWRFRVKRWGTEVNLEVMADGETVKVSANWPLRSQETGFWRSLFGLDMQHGWRPSQHVFITIPAMGRKYALQAHPMTIASAAPTIEHGQIHAWFNLIIRAKKGFSRDLLHYAKNHISTKAILDGPYGSTYALEMLEANDLAIVVAGGSGIAVAYPMLWDLLLRPRGSTPQLCLIWIVQDASHIEWIGMERLEELKALGLDLIIPSPSGKSGRPDVKAILAAKINEVEGSVGIVVSGPDGLNRRVRNVCAEVASLGRRIDVVVEKFGW